MMRAARVGGLHAQVVGPDTGATKGVVVMVHGACTSGRLWTHWAPRLAQRGLEVWCLDLRGHGQSDGREQLEQTCLEDYVADVLAVIGASGGQALVGHDMGGLIGQVVATRTPLRGLVLVNTTAPRGVGGPGSVLEIWRQVFRPRLLRALLRSGTWSYTHEELLALSSDKLTDDDRNDMSAWLGPESSLAAREVALTGVSVEERKVACPTLVVATTFDTLTPPARQRLIASRYRADYVEFAQHAHFPMIETDWERPVAVVGRWLEEAARLHGDTRGSVGRMTAARRSATGTPLPGMNASDSPVPGATSPLPGDTSPVPAAAHDEATEAKKA